MDKILEVENLNVTLDNQKILEDISFEVEEDETLAVIGPNGAGKTVLFRALLNLIPYEGEITWRDGIKIGYVPQRLSIEADLPLTVYEFLHLKEKNKKEIYSVLESVGINTDSSDKKHIIYQKLGVLSGGELQKILIAWAVLGHPDVLLFDEPTSGIDISSEETIYSLLHKLQAKEKLTIILISHELYIVNKYASKVICLNKQRVCFGPPKTALDKESLEKLYGGDVGVYEHHDHHAH